jgi:hypothetical protein
MPDIDRISRLCDLEDIRDLRARYGDLADTIDGQAGDPAAFASLFSSDGTIDFGEGSATGRKQIEEMLRGLPMSWQYVKHCIVNHLITLDGDRASGRVSLLVALAMDKSQAPVWVSGLYHDKYVRTPEGWRFQSVRFEMHFADPAFTGI